MTYVYVVEATVGVGLVLLYYFVALPGFKEIFEDNVNPPAAVAGLSITYFIIAGIFEAYGLHPLLIYIIEKTAKQGLQSLSSIDIK